MVSIASADRQALDRTHSKALYQAKSRPLNVGALLGKT